MMSHIILRIRAVGIGLLIILTVIAEGQETWNLDKCIEEAITNNIQLHRVGIYMSDASVEQKMDEHRKYPSVRGSTKFASEYGKSIDPTTNQFINRNILSTNFGISANMILYSGGSLNNRIKKGNVDRQFLDANKEDIIDKVSIEVISAYFDVLLFKENYTNINVQLTSISNQIALLDKLILEGSRAVYELDDLRAEYAQGEQRLILAKDKIEEAMLQFKGIMNVDRNLHIELELPISAQKDLIGFDSLSIGNFIDELLPIIPELRAHNLLINSSELDVAFERALGKPIVSLSSIVNTNFSNQSKRELGSISILNESSVFIDGRRSTLGVEERLPGQFQTVPYLNQLDDNFSFGINVNMKIPIFDNYVSKGNTQRAQLRVEILKGDKNELVQNIRDELLQFWNNAKSAQRYLLASEKLLSARQLAFDHAVKRFKFGAISSYDFVNLHEKLNITAVEYVIAKYGFFKKMKILEYWNFRLK